MEIPWKAIVFLSHRCSASVLQNGLGWGDVLGLDAAPRRGTEIRIFPKGLPGLVNVYITDGKITMLLMEKLTK